MQKTEVLEELPHLTKSQDRETPLAFAKLDYDESLNDKWLTADEDALPDRRLAAYIKDPYAGSSWKRSKADCESYLVVCEADQVRQARFLINRSLNL